MRNSLILLILFLSSPFYMKAQIVTDCNSPFNDASALASFVLADLSFSNASLNVEGCFSGYFNGVNSNIEINEGIVLATGGVESIYPGGFSNGNNNYNNDIDLSQQLQLIGATTTNLNNVVLLEFDFIPDTNFISFEYVFASKEYPGYTCSQFNDIFGLFLSGPEVSGPFSNDAKNIALVPDPNNPGSFTETPVVINTINSGVASSGNSQPCDDLDSNWQDYSVFFTDNSEGTVSFPGFTVPLIASSEVISGETYHLKIAIADVMDASLNSAIFIKGSSAVVIPTLSSGCTDSLALNYDPLAEINDGSCVYELNCNETDIVTLDNLMYIPDGSGVTYTSTIYVNSFGLAQTLTDINDLPSINVNMEHSYAGDLDMFITAPNGVEVQLFEQAGGGTWFGEAIDQDSNEWNPGIGYDYGWSMNPSYNGTMADGMVNNTSPDPAGGFSNILNSDTYLPVESLNALLGTPLNGEWTLIVVDNLSIDNGWIFSWGLSINPELFPECVDGCTNIFACNYDDEANNDDGSCILPELYYDCDGVCINDIDLDGECDEVDFDDEIGIVELTTIPVRLIKMVDILGREHKVHKNGMLLFYIYENGKVEKRLELNTLE